MTQPSASAKQKPVLDEGSFQKLLQAAYVLQEHNHQLRLVDTRSNGATAQALAEIIEIHRSVDSGELDQASALRLIATRALHFTGASGVAVGMLQGREIVYRVASGTAAQDEGLRLPLDSSLASECISKARTLRFPAVDDKPAQNFVQLCQQRGAKELIAAPILRESKVVGAVELRAGHLGDFQETDVHLAELMAALVGEVIIRDSDHKRGEGTAGEKIGTVEASEAMGPERERFVGDQGTTRSTPAINLNSKAPAVSTEELANAGDGNAFCPCGNRFEGHEKFCGKCGTARFADSRREMQSQWASLWYLQQVKTSQRSKAIEDGKQEMPPVTDAPASLEEIVTRLSSEGHNETDSAFEQPHRDADFQAVQPPAAAALQLEASATDGTERPVVPDVEPVSETSGTGALDSDLNPGTAIVPVRIVPREITAQTQAIESFPRASARRAWEWWVSVRRPNRRWLAFQWNRHHANVWVGISIILLLAAIFINGWPGTQPANASAHRRHPVARRLTLFEQLLVSLGIAEPPPPPVYYGNPAAKVWVDVHTALYYCSGADLYGKTEGGRVTTQQDAQRDQFEPANRRACD